MSTQLENDENSLAANQAKLEELERQEGLVENREHKGFGDAVELTRIESEIETLDVEVSHEKERVNDEARYGRNN